MLSNPQKFEREVQALKGLKAQTFLRPSRQEELKAALLKKIADTPQDSRRSWLVMGKRQRILHYAVLTFVGISLVSGTTYASSSAMPGDLLYSVKRTKEKVETVMAVSAQSKANRQAEQAQERIVELEQLKAKPEAPEPDLKHRELEEKAEHEAEIQVSAALETLTKVKTELEAKGKTRAAESVDKNIQRLSEKAKNARIKSSIFEKKNDSDQSEKPTEDGQVRGESTTKTETENMDAGSTINVINAKMERLKAEQKQQREN